MKTRVVHIITKLELGGAQRNTLHTVEHLDPARWDKVLLTGPGGVLDQEAREGRTFTAIFVPALVREVRLGRDLTALLGLTRHLMRLRPDIVHTHSSKAGVLGRLAARLARVPVVVHTVHGFSFSPNHSPVHRTLYRWAERAAAPLTTRFFCVSRANLEEGIRLGFWRRDEVDLVRSGIPLADYRDRTDDPAEVRASLGIPTEAPVVGSVGNFKPQKAPLDLLRAFAAASARVPSARLVVAGDGPLRARAEEEASRLGIADRVHLLGWRRDVPRLLRAFDVFLLTSLWEGLPRSILQARAAGVPVVATAVDGSVEAVEEGVTGYLVAPRDAEAAGSRVATLLLDPGLRRRMGEAATEGLEEFDISEMVRRQEEIYARLLSGRGSRRPGTKAACL